MTAKGGIGLGFKHDFPGQCHYLCWPVKSKGFYHLKIKDPITWPHWKGQKRKCYSHCNFPDCSDQRYFLSTRPDVRLKKYLQFTKIWCICVGIWSSIVTSWFHRRKYRKILPIYDRHKYQRKYKCCDYCYFLIVGILISIYIIRA